MTSSRPGNGGRAGVFRIHLDLELPRVLGVIVIGRAPLAHVGRSLVAAEEARAATIERKSGAPGQKAAARPHGG